MRLFFTCDEFHIQMGNYYFTTQCTVFVPIFTDTEFLVKQALNLITCIQGIYYCLTSQLRKEYLNYNKIQELLNMYRYQSKWSQCKNFSNMSAKICCNFTIPVNFNSCLSSLANGSIKFLFLHSMVVAY